MLNKHTIKGITLTLASILMLFSSSTMAGKTDPCNSSEVFSKKLLTGICWDCTQPIRVAGVPISGSDRKDTVPSRAATEKFCMCKDGLGVPHPGFVTQYWEPYRMVEFPRIAGCMKALEGVRFPFNKTFLGDTGGEDQSGENSTTFRHYHYYTFPVMQILDMFVPASCNPEGYVDIDVMFLSEMDPTWNIPTLAYFSMPENALLSTDLAAVACIPDAISSTFAKRPIQELFWCAGSWGTIYPVGGYVDGPDILNGTSLDIARILTVFHRRGFVKRTVGGDALCGGMIDPTLPKTMYQFTMFDPVPETGDSHVMGESPIIWGFTRTIPGIGEDPTFLIWRWQDCCQIKSGNN